MTATPIAAALFWVAVTTAPSMVAHGSPVYDARSKASEIVPPPELAEAGVAVTATMAGTLQAAPAKTVRRDGSDGVRSVEEESGMLSSRSCCR